ncbi:methyl-accepting chemotaxis protein [Marinomonas algicola]|uniref:methyl-accepting chemotaxis protein n=1 Tax=Marinomonas algicola TaxID=2773454 RepID=UPI00174BE1FA|nr:methyl-accepting chemotaxis protein [Marinomonas algicola]
MTNALRKVSINYRLLSLVVFFSFGLFVTGYFSLSISKQAILDAKYAQTKHVVETAMGVIEHFHELEESGALNKEQAQYYAMNTIKGTRYSGSEYFWINDYNATMIMHSVNPALDGKYLRDLEDAKGRKFFEEMVRIVKKSNAGFVEYLWPKANSKEPIEKISYVKGFKEWDWILGSGIYLDDVDEQFMSKAIEMTAINSIFVLAGLLISYIIVGSILRPLGEVQTALQNIADGDGDLSRRLPVSGNDKITKIAISYNTFIDRLSNTLSEAILLNKEVEVQSQNLKVVSHSTQQITQERESMFLEMEKTIEEVDGFKGQVTESTRSTLSSAQVTVDKTNTGQESIKQTVQSLDHLSHELESGLKTVVQLAEQSQTIGSVLDVISAIAEQTNLLALNAAIEAARAGEQGRGFAVVADEVRGLASRTQASTDEIQAMISKLQNGAKQAEERITESHKQSQKTTEEIALTTQYLQEIAASVEDITQASSTVLENVNRQSDAVQRLNNLNQKVAELSGKVSAQITQNSDTSDALAETSKQTQKVMSTFKL